MRYVCDSATTDIALCFRKTKVQSLNSIFFYIIIQVVESSHAPQFPRCTAIVAPTGQPWSLEGPQYTARRYPAVLALLQCQSTQTLIFLYYILGMRDETTRRAIRPWVLTGPTVCHLNTFLLVFVFYF